MSEHISVLPQVVELPAASCIVTAAEEILIPEGESKQISSKEDDETREKISKAMAPLSSGPIEFGSIARDASTLTVAATVSETKMPTTTTPITRQQGVVEESSTATDDGHPPGSKNTFLVQNEIADESTHSMTGDPVGYSFDKQKKKKKKKKKY
eukprot:Trichotokara_eunicae@DN7088_c0_g1_i1.p1